MLYSFMSLRPATDGEGWEPDFPDDVSFVLLADINSVDWGLYKFEPPDSNHAWRPEGLIDKHLAALIDSGRRYPPALAMARYAVRHRFGEAVPTQREFAAAYGESLRHFLAQQSASPFVLALALRDDAVDLTEGEWYWIVKVKGNPPIACWVSDDFFIYENPVTYFDLTQEHIEKLRGNVYA